MGGFRNFYLGFNGLAANRSRSGVIRHKKTLPRHERLRLSKKRRDFAVELSRLGLEPSLAARFRENSPPKSSLCEFNLANNKLMARHLCGVFIRLLRREIAAMTIKQLSQTELNRGLLPRRTRNASSFCESPRAE